MASVINQIKVGNIEYAIAASAYAECATTGNTAEKIANICTDNDNTSTLFTLIKGVSVNVKFTNSNTAAKPTLNVNGTGAKPIYFNGYNIPTYQLRNGRIYTFVYNGTTWDLIGDCFTGSGSASRAVGVGCYAKGNYSHAQGYNTHALGTASSAEGYGTHSMPDLTTGAADTAQEVFNLRQGVLYKCPNCSSLDYDYDSLRYEDLNDVWYVYCNSCEEEVEASFEVEPQIFNAAIGIAAHSEGKDCVASGQAAHAEGQLTVAAGSCAHAEGYESYTTAPGAHAEGYKTKASGAYSHAEGGQSIASRDYSHAEGQGCTASGSSSHAGGYYSLASGNHSFTHSYQGVASGTYAVSLGYMADARALESIAIGSFTEVASAGKYGIAIGYNANVTGEAGMSLGYSAYAHTLQTTMGKYNKKNTDTATVGGQTGQAFIIGNGVNNSNRSNAFRVTYGGTVYGLAAFQPSGADYAEYFEWADKNPTNEDRRGYFVTLAGEEIKFANPGDYILGIISGLPSVIGNSDEDWRGRYILDEFGAFISEEYEEEEEVPVEVVNEKTKEPEIIMQKVMRKGTRYKQNPDYDPEKEYIQRADRPEWAAVGMLGVLHVRDDGTCQVNGYCTVAEGGIATASETGYRVISRVNDHIVKVIFR